MKNKIVEELQQKIEQFFFSCDPYIAKIKVRQTRVDGTQFWADDETITDQRPCTMSGLAHAPVVSHTKNGETL